jgi:hypothetical protein
VDKNPSVVSLIILKDYRSVKATVVRSQHFIAGPAEQESGADWRAVAGLAPVGVQRLSRRTVSPSLR